MENCVFCNLELNKGEVLFETGNFFANIGVGLVAPGHMMLIPKRHYDCCADLPQDLRPEFDDAAKMIFGKIEKVFGAPFLVEYGVFGQSVSHAHLHFIPKIRKATEFYSTGRMPRGFASGMDVSPERAKRAEVEQTFPTAQRKRSGRNTSPPWRGVVYSAYEVGDVFREMRIPDDIPARPASWEAAAGMKKQNGGYVFLQDGDRAVLFERFEQELSYRHFFNHRLALKDIPARWQDITEEQLRIDAVKKQITKTFFKF